MRAPKPIPQSLLDEVVYDEESPSCLYWVRTGSGRTSRVAGSNKNKRGYWRIPHKASAYIVHRLIWAIHYGLDVPPVLDHINGDKSDNRIINLRDGTEHNQANRDTWVDNRFKGVHPTKSGRFRMFCGMHLEEGVNKMYDTEIEAALAYNEAALRLYGEYAHLNTIN